LSELLVELNDKAELDEVFESILAQPRDVDRGHYYQALVDYGDGLARLSDDQRAWSYFEDAINFHPEQNIEAINRYTSPGIGFCWTRIWAKLLAERVSHAKEE
jgi:hypothetical protein